MAAAPTARLPVWPTASIIVLLIVSVILPAIALTVMNGALVLLAVMSLMVGGRSIDRRLLHVVIPFGLMVVCGLVSGVGAERYPYFKDAWYVLNPVLVILAGYVFFKSKPDLARGLRAFAIGGTVVAIWQLRPYMFQPDLITLSAETIRHYVGSGLYAPVLALVIFLAYFGRWKSDLLLPSWLAGLMFVICCLSVAGVFSRTALLVVLVGVAAWLGAFARREWVRVGIPMLIVAVFAFTVQLFVDTDSDRALRTFAGKLAHTFQELTVSDYSGLRDINLSYRGHETQQALNQYASGDLAQLLIGRGFGATVDLGVFLPIEFDEAGTRINVRQISVLHNGYAYILTKAGAAGIALYVYVLIYLYRLARPLAGDPTDVTGARAARLMQAAVVTFATTTYVVAGVFNKQDMFPFLLLTGFLIAYLPQLRVQRAST